MTLRPPHTVLPERSPRLGGSARARALQVLLLLCLFFACSPGSFAAPEAAAANSEYQVKAAFIYNFMKFVDWPGDGLYSPGVLTLGILGKDPFGNALDEIGSQTAKGRRVVVIRFKSVEEMKECDILFVCASEKGRLPQILKQVQHSRTLTVADQEGFCLAGGMINLVFINKSVGFEVNVAAATRARLRISSKLLRLARNVIE